MQAWAAGTYYEDDDDDAPPPGFEHRRTPYHAHAAPQQHHVQQVASWSHQEHMQQRQGWQQPQAAMPAHETTSNYRNGGRPVHANAHSQLRYQGPPAAGAAASTAGYGGPPAKLPLHGPSAADSLNLVASCELHATEADWNARQFSQQPISQQQQQQQHYFDNGIRSGYSNRQPSGWEPGNWQPATAVAEGADAAASSRSAPFCGPAPDYGTYKADDGDYGGGSSTNTSGMARQLSGRHGRSSHTASKGQGGSRRRNGSSSGRPVHASPPAPPAAAASPGRARATRTPPDAHTPQRSPTPDYGPYGNNDSDEDYGRSGSSRAARSRRRRPAAGNDSRQKQQQQQQQQQHMQPAASSVQAATAASQALVGIHASSTPGSGSRSRSPKGGGGGGGRRSRGGKAAAARKAAGRVSSSAAGGRHAELEAELAVLRAALAEAEERQVEAQMAVLTLETDKSTLEAQLQGMRAQKQQLEMMLLFGDEPQPVAGGGGMATYDCLEDEDEGKQSDGDCYYQSDDEQYGSHSSAAVQGAHDMPGQQQDAAQLQQLYAPDEASGPCDDDNGHVGSHGSDFGNVAVEVAAAAAAARDVTDEGLAAADSKMQ